MLRPAVSIVLAVFAATTGNKFPLTIDNIMRGPNLVGTEPAQVRWSGDSSKFTFSGKRHPTPLAPLWTPT
jgi:hypothetical protein